MHAFSALEAATELAREFFNQPGHQPDPHYLGHTVRYHVARLSLDPSFQASHGFRLYVMPNTGLEVISNGDRIRIWKATFDEEIPAPGDSSGRLDFCDQPQQPLFEPGAYAQNPGKLVLLWDVDSNNSLSLVKFACPWYWDNAWKSPETHWNERVPHPANWVEIESFNADGDDGFGLELDDTGEPEE